MIVDSPKIAVVGCGAIGLYYGGRMADAGADVHFLLRSDYEQVVRSGIRAKSGDGDFHFSKVQAYHSSSDIGQCDIVIVALKATANEALEKLVSPLLGANTMILTLQNGMGNEEKLAQLFGGERVAGGLCFVCINRIAPGEIEHYGQGMIAMGEFGRPASERLRRVESIMKESRIECRVTDDLVRERWRKLVWNVPFNGLSIAAGGIDVARILKDPGLRKLTVELMKEVIAAAALLGHDLPEGLIEDQIQRTDTMGAYKPSSMIDFVEERAVEVEAIWGNALRAGQAAGAGMPRLEMLYFLLRNLCPTSKVEV